MIVTLCEACGGDGLIEIDAYRGGEQPETRQCQLCGGNVTANPSSLAKPAPSAAISAVRSTLQPHWKPISRKRIWSKRVNSEHVHDYQNPQWDEYRECIRFHCTKCKDSLLFSTSCQLVAGTAPPNIKELSSRAAKFHLARKAKLRGVSNSDN